VQNIGTIFDYLYVFVFLEKEQAARRLAEERCKELESKSKVMVAIFSNSYFIYLFYSSLVYKYKYINLDKLRVPDQQG